MIKLLESEIFNQTNWVQLYHVQKARQEYKEIECSVNRRGIIRYRANETNEPSLDYKSRDHY